MRATVRVKATQRARRRPNPVPGRFVLEIRPLHGMADFAEATTPELRAQEHRLREAAGSRGEERMRERGGERMMADPRMREIGEMPFDGKRMILGGFRPVVDERA